jgi:hypothetical protein
MQSARMDLTKDVLVQELTLENRFVQEGTLVLDAAISTVPVTLIPALECVW